MLCIALDRQLEHTLQSCLFTYGLLHLVVYLCASASIFYLFVCVC